jgi:predicted ATPase/class 3 adenylate cyclase
MPEPTRTAGNVALGENSAPYGLPTGIVTFLFTDVEGSTRLWQHYRDGMGPALARHDELIERLVTEHDGQVVRPRGEGDSRFAVFPKASEAVAAACAIQRALSIESWPILEPLRVRMALHTGEADWRDGDYYGSDVNRCARLRAAAHGGQTLLSGVTADLVRDALPEQAALRDLGVHGLKDLPTPERVYQLAHPDLRQEFPPLASLTLPKHNFPVQLTSFIGREREVAEIQELLASNRLVTLTGTGGVGKTRLALRAAAEVLDAIRDGVWFVDLAPVTDGALVERGVLAAVGGREQPAQSARETLITLLRSRNTLLLLDNCEHLLDTTARLTAELLRQCPRVRVMATSREVLGLPGEAIWRVPSLSSPIEGPHQPPEQLLRYDAVRLFVERARLAQPAFTVSDENADAVTLLCTRLDGIPLAIELAAARLQVLSVAEIVQRLDHRFQLLTGGKRGATQRHQTLQALVDWSHDLLPDAERVLFRRLAVFASGWDLEAAEAVCTTRAEVEPDPRPSTSAFGTLNPSNVLDLTAGLVDKSLVVTDQVTARSRYRLLETIRQYAQQKLLGSGEAETLRARHAAHYLAQAEQAESQLFGAFQESWFDYLETNLDNVRATLTWFISSVSHGDEVLRLAGALWRFWHLGLHHAEGVSWLERALACDSGQSSVARARALARAAYLATWTGQTRRAKELAQQGLELAQMLEDRPSAVTALQALGDAALEEGFLVEARKYYEACLDRARAHLGDQALIGLALHGVGRVAAVQRDYTRARDLFEQALMVRRGMDDELGAAISLYQLGRIASDEGDAGRARPLLEEALSLLRHGSGQKWGVEHCLLHLSEIARRAGDQASARAMAEEAVMRARQDGDIGSVASALGCLGRLALDRRDLAAARQYQQERLRLQADARNRFGIVRALEQLALVAAADGDSRGAAMLFGAADGLASQFGITRRAVDQTEYTQDVARVRAQAEVATTFDDAWTEGQMMTLEHVVGLALTESADHRPEE